MLLHGLQREGMTWAGNNFMGMDTFSVKRELCQNCFCLTSVTRCPVKGKNFLGANTLLFFDKIHCLQKK